MTTKFTPGPWQVDKTTALGAYGVWTEYGTHRGQDPNDPDLYSSAICSMCADSYLDRTITREQKDANAALIAAAPEMFAALKATDAYFAACAAAWATDPEKRVVNADGKLIVEAEGLDELAEVAAEKVSAALAKASPS